ncbi:phage holin family protein [Flavobacterium kingsejongi]|uniref:Phage holin family protein n=1 Tax=Flavobacterium kingsejongi TaxID=1678728 RepID=A0A2S1LJQ0_9FLAO|nr:phage holin family protein [Flavobacterium kingsejongi]AWG23990.1 hypothetical protein FK004_01530 [Flavobacterium kingsejongi]
MRLIIRILLSAVLVYVLANFLPGVVVDGFKTSVIVAIVLGLLNIFIKPILVLFTLPVTILTFGLFLLVINALIILLCAELVDGFHVNGWLTALLFSVILSVFQSILFSVTDEK